MSMFREIPSENGALAEAAARADRFAPFLRGAIGRNPGIVSAATDSGIDAAIEHALASIDAPTPWALRKRRDALALAVALGDLAGLLPLERVTGLLTEFADDALDQAIGFASAQLPGGTKDGFTALALGKQGGHELNYSSDIDPILLFDPATVARRPRDEPAEAAVRIARRVIETLQARDADGYVLRVDLRLRPSPEVTPIALPVDAAIGHYEGNALAWERAAFIKARACAGDVALGERFLEAIRPFVWRRSLDFGAIGELRGLTRRIREHYHEGQTFGPGYDLKRGRGGIREIEFFVQIHQLIHGGRNPDLRERGTLAALDRLRGAGLVADDAAATLTRAYRRLRTIEHRVQMIDDRQTHLLPADPNALDAVARLHGAESGDALLDWLRDDVAAVEQLYDELEGETPKPVAVAWERFASPEAARSTVATWRGGRVRALRSAAGAEAFAAIEPALLDAIARTPEPETTLIQVERLLERLPSAVNLFRLLAARPALLDTLVRILAFVPTLADALALKPALLDRLIEGDYALPGLAALIAEMAGQGTLEERLDRVRHAVDEHRFALGVALVEGRLNALAVAAGYARTAEAAVDVVTRAVVAEFARAHGRVPESEFVVLALGRLGGGELTHASDLDLVYLFTGDHLAESDGARPLGASLYYNRLAARVSTALSAPTAAGALYPVDTRLRPSGAQGPLAVSTDSFARYQGSEAWTWEHMALARARPVFGSDAARNDLTIQVDRVLRRRRDAATVARDVVGMRAEMRRHKPAAGPWDVKLVEGGLVDLEFVVHFHQLATGEGLSPHLTKALSALAATGRVELALAEVYCLLTRLLVTLRLVAPALDLPPPATRDLIARCCGLPGWPIVEAEYQAARDVVARHWQRLVETAGDQP